MDDEHMAKVEVAQCRGHRLRDRGLRCPLEFQAPSLRASRNEQVELRASVGGPEKALFSPELENAQNLFVLPTCRAPIRPTTGLRSRAAVMLRRWRVRGIIAGEFYLEN